ncbi:MmgE/PrpD family protein [Cryptosporangium aurantiacum]|uniref:2-methylcitrate dehydratase PrpD n=1 Tax=Cryptosporangium aurantiacum TaxID=134849 RepID=A0A1M7R3M0_9ACTN|nr:MmgE/PrpD family protein [Cryptosporangium aurantiacum]SHN39606.1 2-methylcitrate dehydratase PrpD [Cryptosporangium aurantiacum]
MARTTVEQLADFAADVSLEAPPPDVVEDSKRVLLDSVGCALAGIDVDKGRIGIKVARRMGGRGDATIFGVADRTTPFAAAFANAESINALDFDAVLPPGHVAPYVLPGALALAEERGASGARVLEAIAVSHEMSYRFSRAMDYTRTVTGTEIQVATVLGFTSAVFGAAAAAGLILGQDREVLADAIGIAGAITPVNSYRTWMMNVPNSTIKYSMAGPVAQAGMTAAFSAEDGHTGDRTILDDAEYGYRRFIGSERWEPGALTEGLGVDWLFPAHHSYKPYPHCRVTHGPFDALTEIVTANDLRPDEIDAIRCWGEAWVELPVWLSTTVDRPHQAQFSIRHGLAVSAHRIPPGKAWQLPETLRNPSVVGLMEKVSFAPHPDYVATLSADPSARPTRVEVDARGTTFSASRTHPKGTPSADPSIRLSTDELVEKFRANADGVLPAGRIDDLLDGILNLEKVENVSALLARTAPPRR